MGEFNFLNIPIEEVFSFIQILAYGIGLGADVGREDKIHIHRVISERAKHSIGRAAVLVYVPNLHDDQFGIEQHHRLVVGGGDLMNEVRGYGVQIIARVRAVEGLDVLARVFLNP